MTKQANDKTHFTEFSLWLREQQQIASNKGYTCTNVDYVWTNYKTGAWMIIEEKRHMANIGFAQDCIFKMLDKACKLDKNYRGFHFIKFENTSPEDGKIYLDGKLVSKQELIDFLSFVVK